MIIKVLGSGCANCRRLLENTKKAVAELGVKADVLYITDMMAIAEAGLLRTPGLIINDKIVGYGRVFDVTEIKTIISKVS